MDERRGSDQRFREITREEFMRDASTAFRCADREGQVVITKADGSPYAVLAVPREPIDFELD
ncbi:hypothetical protein [Paraliomyxa miuraensis]|uniref:hypothetical protein n=1 Tax=Paraliomyxa miuraensis TaxID=376150 RepID=UPI002252A1A4|nr:hypothetical protein [Paraliomyxa miuraensis]MCX4246565.1 hypothetical protein [Paraliomyxa miuraensis]